MSTNDDGWIGGHFYDGFMGRWSRQLAPRFVSWLQIAPGAHWLDVGCGTGALTEAICAEANPASVLGCDLSTQFVEYARQHSKDAQATFVVAQAGSLPERTNGYDCISSLLALNFFPDYSAALEDMRKLVRPGGVVAACVWDYAGKMEFLRFFWDVVIRQDPNARDLDEGIRFPICNQVALTNLFVNTGLLNVNCEAIDIQTAFDSFADYWNPMLAGTGPASAYVASLTEKKRRALERALRNRLPQAQNGTIELTARAWAVRGTAS